MNKIIYKTDEDGVAVLIPTGELSLEETAAKDVPSGRPYKIVDAADISSDRTFRDAWEIDEAELTDGVGADYGVME